jgi:hypothetical protein
MQSQVADKSVRETIFVSETPEIFKKSGFTPLPVPIIIKQILKKSSEQCDLENTSTIYRIS